jgi:hypothetical protein
MPPSIRSNGYVSLSVSPHWCFRTREWPWRSLPTTAGLEAINGVHVHGVCSSPDADALSAAGSATESGHARTLGRPPKVTRRI